MVEVKRQILQAVKVEDKSVKATNDDGEFVIGSDRPYFARKTPDIPDKWSAVETLKRVELVPGQREMIISGVEGYGDAVALKVCRKSKAMKSSAER